MVLALAIIFWLLKKKKAAKAKINKWDYIKIKSLWTAKETIYKIRRLAMEWNKIFAKQISEKGFKKYKKLTQLLKKKKWQGIWIDIFPQKTYQWSTGTWKVLKTTYQRNANQTTICYHLIPVKTDIYQKKKQKTERNKCWQGCSGKKKTEHFYTVGWYINGYSHYGKECGGFSRN